MKRDATGRLIRERGLNFGDALELLTMGDKLAREGWNGKGMWIRIVNGRGRQPDVNELEPTDDPLKFKIVRVHPGELEHLPYLQMKTADDKLVPWLASQTDLLARDWCVVKTDPPAERIGDEVEWPQ